MARVNYTDGSFETDKNPTGYNSACAWFDEKKNCLVVVTGDDGFGLELDDDELEQFIEFLREARRRKVFPP